MTRNRLLIGVAAASVLLTAACSRLCVRPAGANTPGFRYYLPRPFLLVTPDTARIIWLPDTKQQYAVQPRFGVGTSKFNFTFDDGWRLTAVSSDVDAKTPEIVGKVTDLVANLASTVVGAMAKGAMISGESLPGKRAASPNGKIQLYNFVYDDKGILVKLQPLIDVKQ